MKSRRNLLRVLMIASAAFAPALVPLASRADVPRPLGAGPVTTGSADSADGDSSRASSPYWSAGTGSDLPAAEIRAVPVAQAQAVATRWGFYQSQDDLSFALRVSQKQFEHRADVVSAAVEQRDAYAVMQAERVRALSSLNANAAYSAGNQLHRNLTEQIADERIADKPDAGRLLGMASVRLNYVQDNRKIEVSVLERDDAYQKARQRYIDASQRVAALNDEQSLAVMTDSSLNDLRHQVATARVAKLAAAAYYAGMIDARDIALDYAGFTRYYDRHPNYLNGSYGGYYGGYSGYSTIGFIR